MMRRKPLLSRWVNAATLCILFLGVASSTGVRDSSGRQVKATTVPAPVTLESHHKAPGTELTPDPLKSLLVLASLDGTLTALDRVTGDLRWVTKDEPMIKVPSGPASSKAPYFLPDPKTGSLYVMSLKNSIKKLPFTIPQLVAMAPCKNSEGLMYTGRKLDYWLQLNPTTGEKSEVPMHGDSICPASTTDEEDINKRCTAADVDPLHVAAKKSILIGKTEYTLSMAEGHRKWNVTYHHYSAMDMSPQSAQDYDLVHLTSPSSGTVLTYDKEAGQLLWEKDIDSPVIAMYSVDYATSNLIAIPFTPIAPETITRVKDDTSQNNKPLSSKTYIGESNYGLYAVPALVDELVLIMSAEGGKDFPPLIEGPTTTIVPNEKEQSINNFDGRIPPNVPTGNESLDKREPNSSSEADVTVYGFYDVPEPTGVTPVMQIGSHNMQHLAINSLPPGQYNESHLNTIPGVRQEDMPNSTLEVSDPVSFPGPPNAKFPFQFPPLSNKQPITPAKKFGDKLKEKLQAAKPVEIVVSTAVASVGITLALIITGTIFYRRYQNKNTNNANIGKNKSKSKNKNVKKNKVKTSDTEEDVPVARKPKLSADGSTAIGKISFYPTSILGKGCEGTFVYKGKFEDRDVAVKRILPECFAFADREVDLLKESDQHPNVIRYFCTESDGQFRYIALELCEATLSDWIDGKFKCDYMDPIQVLREATDGLSHLHALRIVHRDIKPANVLISLSGSGCRVRTMISDFGLCKKITNGRMSFSRRSGGIPGTDGWIAPEILKNLEDGSPNPSNRMSYSVDVFSLGCVYYFVLTNGEHPFGEPFRRQSNIINGEYNVEKVQSNPQGVYDLINMMISSDATLRPPLSDVLCHPMFWSKEKILAFFLDVSDRIEKEDDRYPLLRRLESDGTRIVKGDWRDHICAEVALDLRRYRTYKGQSVRDLLRALRNKKNHYRELTPEAQASLGHIPDKFTDYWISRFPDLLPYTWLKFEAVKDESIFSKYYPREFSFNNLINGEDSYLEELDDNCDSDGNRLYPPQGRGSSPDKSPKIDKNFWRSKSQFKYNQWRRQKQHTNLRENPHNFTSFATTRYPQQGPPVTPADTEGSWRNTLPSKDKEH